MTDDLVLIIEDNEINRMLARDVLQINGFRTIESNNAEDGVRLATERRPALIVMDFHLPGMNGIEALEKLRGDVTTRDIPVVAVTASAMMEEWQKIKAAGFDGVQTKPIHIKDFVRTVTDLIAGGRSGE